MVRRMRKINERFSPENINKVTGEYLYYKGFITGLQKAIGLDDIKIKALIDVYSVKTKMIDIMIFNKNR